MSSESRSSAQLDFQAEPYENRILCVDALQELPKVPAGIFDVIVTDPVWPGAAVELPGTDNCLEIFQAAAREFARIAPRVIVHLGQKTDPRMLAAISTELPFVQVCWLRFIPPMYHGPILVAADVAYVFGSRHLPGDGSRVFGVECRSVWNSAKKYEAKLDPDNPHPTPRSIDHALWIVSRFTRPGDLVLDPFCGVATYPVAAKLLGRRYCGFDIKPEFVEYGRRRVAAVAPLSPTERGGIYERSSHESA